jgi:hypothetical protein
MESRFFKLTHDNIEVEKLIRVTGQVGRRVDANKEQSQVTLLIPSDFLSLGEFPIEVYAFQCAPVVPASQLSQASARDVAAFFFVVLDVCVFLFFLAAHRCNDTLHASDEASRQARGLAHRVVTCAASATGFRSVRSVDRGEVSDLGVRHVYQTQIMYRE